MADAAYGSLPFREQIAFFRRKLNLPTQGWTDIWESEHDYAFVVAGANRDALVADLRAAVEKAIDGGASLEEFRRDFDRIVATHGWDYRGGRNWRSRVIYETNLATSHAAGRWEQLQAAPFWQYEHADWVTHPRELHLAWDGLVLERDNPWWRTHFPPNGWGCQCSVRGLWPADLARMGRTGPDPTPEIVWEDRVVGQHSVNGPRHVRVPEGIDPGFAYAPGAARARSAIPPERPIPPMPGSTGGPGLPNQRPLDSLPPPRQLPASVILAADLAAETYAAEFLRRLGASLAEPTIVRDVIGERIAVGKELFQDAAGEWKVFKRGREQYLPLLAETLRAPDEIWVRLEWHHGVQRAVVRRRYLAQFAIEGQKTPGLVVFELGADGWAGVTAFPPQSAGYVEDMRIGVRLYSRAAE